MQATERLLENQDKHDRACSKYWNTFDNFMQKQGLVNFVLRTYHGTLGTYHRYMRNRLEDEIYKKTGVSVGDF